MKRFTLNFGLQVATAIIPSLAFLFSVHALSERVDMPTFAAFSVMISIIGLLAVLDGGVGRAATYFVGNAVAKNNQLELSHVVRASLIIGFIFSLFVMIVTYIALNWLSGPALLAAKSSLQTLIFFLPAIVCGSVMKGVLEGLQRFPLSSGLQLLQGLIIGVVPIFIINKIDDLTIFALVVGAVRLSMLAMQIYYSKIALALQGTEFNNSIKNILNYSKWLFVSNLVGLIIIYSDRLLVASVFDREIVSIYILPMEIISRSMIIVSAFASVLFPRLIDHVTISNKEVLNLVVKLRGAITYLTLSAGFLLLPFVDILMTLWMGSELGGQTRWIVMIGVVGVVLASSSTLSMMGINSLGHTRQIAYLHLIELLLMASLLFFAAKYKNLLLVQIAWIFRLCIDVVGMHLILNFSANRKALSLSNILLSITELNYRAVFRFGLIILLIGLLLGLTHIASVIDRGTLIIMTAPFALGLIMLGYNNAHQAKKLLRHSSGEKIYPPRF